MTSTLGVTTRKVVKFLLLGYLCLSVALIGCSPLGAPDSTDGGTQGASETGGDTFAHPELTLSPADPDALRGSPEAVIDTSNTMRGYVSAAATSDNRLKLQVTKDDMSYYYDMPGDGAPLTAPINMGEGAYTFQIMQNTRSNLYAPLGEPVTSDVVLESEYEPFIRPNVYCDYDADSLTVEKADELSAGAENQGEVLKAVYEWIVDNIRYDDVKATDVVNGTRIDGYIPDPDTTLREGTGICFDYASLAAAMLRSQGIPCKIITGDVSPDNIYHAWNMVYLNGSWISAQVIITPNTWTRVDFTFAAGGATEYAGDTMTYTEKLTY